MSIHGSQPVKSNSQLPFWESIGHVLTMETCFMRLQQDLGMQACIIQPILLQYNYMGRRIPITAKVLASPFLRILCPTACHSATHIPEPWLTDMGCLTAGAIKLFPDRDLYFQGAKTLTHIDPFSGTRLPPIFQIRPTPPPGKAWSSFLRASVLAATDHIYLVLLFYIDCPEWRQSAPMACTCSTAG